MLGQIRLEQLHHAESKTVDFPGGPVVKNPLASAGDTGLISGQGRFHMPSIPLSPRPGLISFRMDWFDLLAVQGTLKSLLQHPVSAPAPWKQPLRKDLQDPLFPEAGNWGS